MASVLQLRAQATLLAQSAREVRSQVRKLRRKEHAAIRHSAPQWRVLQACVRLRRGDMDVARAYFDKHIAAKDSRLQWTMYRQDLAAWWEACTAEGHHSSSEDAPVPDSRAMAVATHFLQGLALHDWVHVQNFLHGATPDSIILLAHAATSTSPPAPVLASALKRKSKLQWLARWRTKWRVKLANVSTRAHMATSEAQEKALCR